MQGADSSAPDSCGQSCGGLLCRYRDVRTLSRRQEFQGCAATELGLW